LLMLSLLKLKYKLTGDIVVITVLDVGIIASI
jgi:hypothetical protein